MHFTPSWIPLQQPAGWMLLGLQQGRSSGNWWVLAVNVAEGKTQGSLRWFAFEDVRLDTSAVAYLAELAGRGHAKPPQEEPGEEPKDVPSKAGD